jgi:hypothetical protein
MSSVRLGSIRSGAEAAAEVEAEAAAEAPAFELELEVDGGDGGGGKGLFRNPSNAGHSSRYVSIGRV